MISKKEQRLTKAEIQDKIHNEPDFIYSKKNNFSLNEFLKESEKTIHDYQLSRLLKMKKYEINKIYKNALKKLKLLLGDDFRERE